MISNSQYGKSGEGRPLRNGQGRFITAFECRFADSQDTRRDRHILETTTVRESFGPNSGHAAGKRNASEKPAVGEGLAANKGYTFRYCDVGQIVTSKESAAANTGYTLRDCNMIKLTT